MTTEPISDNRAQKKDRTVYLIIALFAVSLLVRLIQLKNALSVSGFVLFDQADAYYHLRRTIMYAYNFPSLPSFDPYLAFPSGSECPWPPLYDLFAALLSRVFSGGAVNVRVIEITHSVLPPVIAALAVIPLFYLAKHLYNDTRIAVVASVIFIFAPGLLNYSHAASGDHHAAEVLLALCFFICVLNSLDKIRMGRPSTGTDILAGLSLTAGMLVWQVQIVYYSLFALFTGITMLFRRKDALFPGRVMTSVFVITAVSALVVSAVRISIPVRSPQALFSFEFFSFFQPFYLCVVCLGLYLIYTLCVQSRSRARTAFIVLAVLCSALLFWLMRKTFIPVVSYVMSVLLREKAHYASIIELMPTFRSEYFTGDLLNTASNSLMLISFLIPVVYSCYRIYHVWKDTEKEDGQAVLFISIMMLITSLLALYQSRWNNIFSMFFALMYGLLIIRVYDRAAHYLRFRMTAGAVVAVCACVFFIPYLSPVGNMIFRQTNDYISQNLLNTLLWMRNNTPPPGGLWQPDAQPGYGVMARWDYGNIVLYYAERPVMSSNFESVLQGQGFNDSVEMWNKTDEADIVKICGDHKVRYLLLSRNEIDLGQLQTNSKFLQRGLVRLMLLDGSSSRHGAAMGHFRLIYESEGSQANNAQLFPELKDHMIFERVAGAKVTGRTRPGEYVSISIGLMTNRGRNILWNTAVAADMNGKFNCVIPYASGAANYSVVALSAFEAVSANRKIRFHLSNADVLEGKSVFLDLRSGILRKD